MASTIQTTLDQFEPATSERIREWSKGSIKRRLRPTDHREDWSQVQGTLWDEHLFGPVEDWKCPCGRFSGREYSKVICPVCNVQIAPRKARKIRSAHINLTVFIPHPYFPEAEPLDVVPVVPAVFWETRANASLAEAYEEMVHVSLIQPTADQAANQYAAIVAHLEKLYDQYLHHDDEAAERLTRGMALVPKPPPEVPSDDEDDETDWDNLKLLDD